MPSGRHVIARNKKIAMREAKACSIKHRGEWCDVIVNNIRIAQCFKGKCKKG